MQCASCPLRQIPHFKSITADELARIEKARTAVRRVRANTTIYAEGDPPAEVYTLFDGWAARSKLLENGKRQILNVLLPGDCFGVQPDMTSPLQHSTEALTEVSLCIFQHDEVMRLFRALPTFGWQLSWMLAHEESILGEHLTNIGRRTAFERLGFLLLEIYTRMENREAAANGMCAFPLRQTDIADALALSAETVSRLLARMDRDGLARVTRGKLYILDRQGLADISHFHDRFLTPKPFL